MTALLVVRPHAGRATRRITQEALNYAGSGMGVLAARRVSVQTLLHGLLLPSGQRRRHRAALRVERQSAGVRGPDERARRPAGPDVHALHLAERLRRPRQPLLRGRPRRGRPRRPATTAPGPIVRRPRAIRFPITGGGSSCTTTTRSCASATRASRRQDGLHGRRRPLHRRAAAAGRSASGSCCCSRRTQDGRRDCSTAGSGRSCAAWPVARRPRARSMASPSERPGAPTPTNSRSPAQGRPPAHRRCSRRPARRRHGLGASGCATARCPSATCATSR